MKTIIVSGVPGSGKSTHSASIPGSVVCSADDWFCQSGEYIFDFRELANAHGACLRKFLEAVVNEKEVVIVDNTNTTAEEIIPYYAVSAAYGREIELLTVLCDPIIAAARNKHTVPLEKVVAMAERLNNRVLPGYWSFNDKFSQRTIQSLETR
ncbi:MAG: AAA family ATPase [Ferruginibacter sp.]